MSAPEHNFVEDVLISGENIDSFTAGEALTARTGVYITGDYTVSEVPADTTDFAGVVGYDVASGEETPVIRQNCEVRVSVSETVSAGDGLVPDGSGGFETIATSGLAAGDEVLVANEGGSASDLVEATIVGEGS